MEHLHKLQEMGAVELGEKEGKYQNYRVNWEKFIEVFFEHIYTPRIQEAALRSGEMGDAREKLKHEQKTLKGVMDELRKNNMFREVLQGYFEILVMNMNQGLYPQRAV